MSNKIAKIINSKFSWILEVDGQRICFNGSFCAEYFANHYKELGYEIVWDRDNWKNESE